MPVLGAGRFPIGTTPVGLGLPTALPPTPPAVLPDPTTGLSQTGRLIDQQTGDYVFTADGRLEGMGTVDQLVLLAIDNIDLSTVVEKGRNFTQMISARVQAALSDLVSRGLVQIVSVRVSEPTVDAGQAILSWRDLTEGPNSELLFTPIGTP